MALPVQARAGANLVTLVAQTPGATPFINLVTASMDNPASLAAYTFSVQPKPGSATRPLSARYSSAYLQRRGFLNPATKTFIAPVFGLYENYLNAVTMTFQFVDGHTEQYVLTIQTARYVAPTYIHPKVIQPRASDTTLSYDFILLKNYAYTPSPIILDTDAEIRWVGVSGIDNLPSIFYDNSVFVASPTMIVRMEFDGAVTLAQDETGVGVVNFFHNFDFGRNGILADVVTACYLESTVMEFAPTGSLLHTWDLGSIISQAMIAGGDDPSPFVAPSPADWFHVNSATYRPADNSLIVSSRENFVIALDYDSGAIKWIFGDPTKAWHQYQSLRKYELRHGPDTHAPIGQHAVSIVDNMLLLFDDGAQSSYHVPQGKMRSYSAPRMYKIDEKAKLATEVWNYENGRNVSSQFCSSVYVDLPNNYLIDYTLSNDNTKTELLGLDDTLSQVFQYEYSAHDSCATGWNAVPIHLENLVFD